MTTAAERPSPTRAGARYELTLAMLGAVSSAVVTGVLDQMDASTTVKLIGLVVGAALPPFVAVTGRRRPIRVAAAMLLTVLALVFSYGGWQIFAKVSGTSPVLPRPSEIVDDVTSTLGHGTDAVETSEGPLGIRVSPDIVECGTDGTCDTVTVTSTGTEPLSITGLELEGESAAYVTASGCEDAVLATDEACAITLGFTPENAPESDSTHLVIHQNLSGPATSVPLVAHGLQPALPNLTIAGEAACTVEETSSDPDTGTTAGVLTVEAPMSGTDDLAGSTVGATVSIDGTVQWAVDVEVSSGSVFVSGEYEGQPPTNVLVILDPAGQVAESNEDDNYARCL